MHFRKIYIDFKFHKLLQYQPIFYTLDIRDFIIIQSKLNHYWEFSNFLAVENRENLDKLFYYCSILAEKLKKTCDKPQYCCAFRIFWKKQNEKINGFCEFSFVMENEILIKIINPWTYCFYMKFFSVFSSWIITKLGPCSDIANNQEKGPQWGIKKVLCLHNI